MFTVFVFLFGYKMAGGDGGRRCQCIYINFGISFEWISDLHIQWLDLTTIESQSWFLFTESEVRLVGIHCRRSRRCITMHWIALHLICIQLAFAHARVRCHVVFTRFRNIRNTTTPEPPLSSATPPRLVRLSVHLTLAEIF